MMVRNPFLDRLNNDGKQSTAYHHAPKQEKKLAGQLGAHKVPRSGSGPVKGDVRKRGTFRVECKSTCAQSFSITRQMIEKIENAGLASDEIPFINVQMLGPTGKVEVDCAVITMQALRELLDRIK